jgi:hypothetical protein
MFFMSELLNSRLSRRAGFGLAAGALATVATSRAVFAAQGTPEASPVALDELPAGPLGDRIQWLLDLINGDPAAITGDAIAPEFTEEMLALASADEIAAVMTEVATKAGPLTIQAGQIATSLDDPPSTAVFRTDGRDGVVVQITIAVDTTSGLITGLVFTPLGFTLDAPMAATPAA